MLSVVLPTRNERDAVELLIYALLTVLEAPTGGEFELIVVDDSNDGSDAYLAERLAPFAPRVDFWHRPKGTGLATAIVDGIRRARRKYVLLMDADFNHNPLDVPKLLQQIQEGGMHLASGSRFLPGGAMEGHRFRFYGSLLFNLFVRRALGLATTDHLAGFWIMERERVLELQRRWDLFYGYGDYYIRLLAACQVAGLKVEERMVRYLNRPTGESKTNFRKELARYTRSVLAIRRELPDIQRRLDGWS
jgi:dolichol-phosphate mannosyltransferase